jgi:uncharacterized protein with LGFP repeats
VRSLTGALVAALVLLPAAPAWAAGQPPVVVDDTANVRNMAMSQWVHPLDNDSDPDGDQLTYTSVTNGTKGKAFVDSEFPTYLDYQPYPGVTAGTDSFTYTVSDGQGNTATGTVTVTLWDNLAAPSGLTISSAGPDSVTLTWAPVAGATQYRVHRAGGDVTTTGLTYTDTGLADINSYLWHVGAVNAGGFESSWSDPVYRDYKLSTPTSLTVRSASSTSLSVDWDGAGVGLWEVYRDGVLVASPTVTEFVDSGLVTGREYSYQVQSAYPSTTTIVRPPSALSAVVRGTPVPSAIEQFSADHSADLGPVTVPERAIPGGRQQDHQNGLVVQQDGDQALAVLKPFSTAYLAVGGPTGDLGFPFAEQQSGLRDGGSGQLFEGGSIWHTALDETWLVYQVIENGWAVTGWEEGPLGYPVDELVEEGGVWGQAFEGGAVFWSVETGSHGVSGEIWNRFTAPDNENGWPGPPASDWLGLPTSDEVTLLGGSRQDFQGGTVSWSAAGGARTVHGAIRGAWADRGAETGWLGFPVTDEAPLWGGGVMQRFQNGSLYWSAAGGAHTVHGAIRGAWDARGGAGSWLGYPVSDELALRGGVMQHFQNGSMYWSAAGGAHTVHGAIRSGWNARGAENGWLGYPVSDELPLWNGGVMQNFQNGSMYWSAAGGAHTVHGAIRGAWEARGAVRGWLGYPVTDEIALRGGVAQVFQNGSMYWSAVGGAHTVHGAIRAAWAGQGAEGGRLGYPVTDEVASRGNAVQYFQGGSITWQSSTARATVTFNR